MWALCCAALAISAITGCRSGVYRARDLPPEYAAPVARSAQQLDLSGLARSERNLDVIYPRDLVNVTIDSGLGVDEIQSWEVRVTDRGKAQIPIVGTVKLGGLETSRAEQLVLQECRRRRLYRHPRISVEIKSRGTNQVAVMGAVKNPST